MIQMTLIQIDNYGPWTVTPRPRTESDLQMLQASLFADLNNHFGNKKGLVFFTRFDNLLAISNGLNEEDHLRIQRSIRNRYPITISMGVGAAETPHEAQKLATIALQKAGSIHKHILGILTGQNAADTITGGLGLIGNDGNLFAYQMVGQSGLTNIGTAGDGNNSSFCIHKYFLL